jgi:hypothetical protein
MRKLVIFKLLHSLLERSNRGEWNGSVVQQEWKNVTNFDLKMNCLQDPTLKRISSFHKNWNVMS